MNAWSSPVRAHRWSRYATTLDARLVALRRIDLKILLACTCLVLVLIAQGVAITESYLWAAPIACLLLIALAADLPLGLLLGAALLARVSTDDLSSTASRHSGSLDISSLIAGLFILLAIGLVMRRRQSIWPAAFAALWLALWTGIAVNMDGASALTVREGVREASIVAVAVIACNAGESLGLSRITRIVQVAGLAAALIALYQLATHTGQSVHGEIRSTGTFSQPNAAAVFFAIATMASLWRFLEAGRTRLDAAFLTVFAAATISTFSLGGLACLLVMLLAFGLLRPGSLRLKLSSCAVAAVVVAVFLATPLGAERLASESATNFSSTGARAATGSSLEWRLDKWRALIPEWEHHPLLGRGLGTTTTTEGTSENHSVGILPHSEIVRYLVETGAVGFILVLGATAIVLSRFARLRRTPGLQQAGTLGIAISLGILVNSVGANTLLYTPAAYAAAAIAATALVTRQAPTSPPHVINHPSDRNLAPAWKSALAARPRSTSESPFKHARF
jgi:O-antigen ligase